MLVLPVRWWISRNPLVTEDDAMRFNIRVLLTCVTALMAFLVLSAPTPRLRPANPPSRPPFRSRSHGLASTLHACSSPGSTVAWGARSVPTVPCTSSRVWPGGSPGWIPRQAPPRPLPMACRNALLTPVAPWTWPSSGTRHTCSSLLVGPDAGASSVVGVYHVDGPHHAPWSPTSAAWAITNPPVPAFFRPVGRAVRDAALQGRPPGD